MAADHGLNPTLAGRNEAKLKEMSDQFGYPYRVVDLEDEQKLLAVLQDFEVVLHAAGPFIRTAGAMHQACLKTKTHYLDITGEIKAFAMAEQLDQAAKDQGVMLLPGVGFDVVPTDCMAAYLKEKLPTATHLTLAFAWKGGGVSHGTAMTMLEGLGEPGAVRKDKRIVDVPAAFKVRSFPFAEDRTRAAVTIPWGDVFTAYLTTGIPNIETFFAAPKRQIKLMRTSRHMGILLRMGIIKNFLRRKVAARPAGPSDAQREKALAYVYGEATAANGETVKARLVTLEGYTLTAITALMITKKVLEGQAKPGFQTPAGLFGADLILEVAGTKREDL